MRTRSFDIPHTIEAIAGVLRGRGHEVVLLGDGREFVEKVLAERPDLRVQLRGGARHQPVARGAVSGSARLLGIPYTGLRARSPWAVTLDKQCAKKLVSLAGVAIPRGFALPADAPAEIVPVEQLPFHW